MRHDWATARRCLAALHAAGSASRPPRRPWPGPCAGWATPSLDTGPGCSSAGGELWLRRAQTGVPEPSWGVRRRRRGAARAMSGAVTSRWRERAASLQREGGGVDDEARCRKSKAKFRLRSDPYRGVGGGSWPCSRNSLVGLRKVDLASVLPAARHPEPQRQGLKPLAAMLQPG